MRITKLDGLRGVFSLMVAVYHYPAQYVPGFIHDSFIVAKSHLFVDFFFVLSGFVITYNYHNLINTRAELGRFVQKRFTRLYPLLLYTTLVCLFLVVGVGTFLPQFVNAKQSLGSSLTDTINTLLFLNSTPVFGDSQGMNYPSWSISSEMFAYLFFGVVTLWAGQQKKNSVLASAIFIGMIFIFIKPLMGIEGNYEFVRGIVSFNIGYFVYVYAKKDIKIGNGWEIALLSLFLGLFYIASVVKEDVLWRTIVEACVIPLFFGWSIFTLRHTNGAVSKLMETRPFQFLGKISYSVYLNHSILVVIFPRAIFSFFKLPQSIVTEIAVLILSLLLIIVYSHFTYSIIEVKGGNILKRLWSKRTPVPINEGAI